MPGKFQRQPECDAKGMRMFARAGLVASHTVENPKRRHSIPANRLTNAKDLLQIAGT